MTLDSAEVLDLRIPDVAEDARALAERVLAEDGSMDLTSELVEAHGIEARAVLEFSSGGVLAGVEYADEIFRQCGLAPPSWEWHVGSVVPPKGNIATVAGDLARILRAERPVLNVLQRACGIARMTRDFVLAVRGTGCRILHTRKTAPGLRSFDIRAVMAGGGELHRTALSDAVLVKDNHWQALMSRKQRLQDVCEAARARGISKVYVEVENEIQVRMACTAGASRLLIDNQAPVAVRRWSEAARAVFPGIEIEASGGITLENVRAYAEAGADYVSVGALTHSVQAADLSLEVIR